MATCRGCGANIRFIQNAKRKYLPVDPELRHASDCTTGTKLVQDNGGVVSVMAGMRMAGYIPHWSTCPDADDFRKAK